jgi:serine/threonine protein kinase/exonuclease VII small subunit
MSDLETLLSQLSKGEISAKSVGEELGKLVAGSSESAESLLAALKRAAANGTLDSESYARLRSSVPQLAAAASRAPGDDEDNVKTRFASSDSTEYGAPSTASPTSPPTGAAQVDTAFSEAETIIGTSQDERVESARSATQGHTDASWQPGDTSSSWPTGDLSTSGVDSVPGNSAKKGATLGVGPGSVLRGRFRLDRVLGSGGMGFVYLGSDLIKVRARDKQPLVALKVLNEDFKQHPDAFIALQREASRQQKLAHPNIATVYDFDQTEDGMAFLVMELLEGEPLNEFIKKTVRASGGLPFEQALPMVQGLGGALVYAHERNVVHSDFKPGNCFLLEDGSMKVLDFGIARAVKAPGAAEGETTIFDPGKLGALTPAYASAEMLEGQEPDPRDDIYALACVAYELLTGKHPFNKLAANKARDSGLKPEPIKKLSRRQWRGLARGLAFSRDDRSQSTEEFLREFEGRIPVWRNPVIAGPAVAALLALGGFFPAKNYLQEQKVEALINEALGGTAAQIESVLSQLDRGAVPAAQRDRVLTAARDQVLDYFYGSARKKVDIEQGLYDFKGARDLLEKARSYAVFADSSTLMELQSSLEDSENRLFAAQFERFNQALESGSLLRQDGEDDIFDAMDVIRQVDPDHAILRDRRLPGAFATAINAAIENDDYDYADELGQVGLGLIPGSVNLTNLLDQVAGARDRALTQARVLQAVADIQNAASSENALSAYADIGEAVATLAAADPGNPTLTELRKKIEPLAAREIERVDTSRRWLDSPLLSENFGDLLRGLGLYAQNARVLGMKQELEDRIVSEQAAVTAAVAADELTPAATQALRKLADTSPWDARSLDARDQLAKAWLARAQRARAGSLFADASDFLAQASSTKPGNKVLREVAAESNRVAAESALNPAALESLREEQATQFETGLASFEKLLTALDNSLPQLDAALDALAELQTLRADDPRLAGLRVRLSVATDEHVLGLSKSEQWDEAVALTERVLIDIPDASSLSERLGTLRAERREAALAQQKRLISEAKSTVDSLLEDPVADRQWRNSVRQSMEVVIALGDPTDAWISEHRGSIAAVYVSRAAEMREALRFAEGSNLLSEAENLQPSIAGLAEERAALTSASEAFAREQAEQQRLARLDGLKETLRSQARANDVVAAQKTLDTLEQTLAGDPDSFLERDAPRLMSEAYFRLAVARAEVSDFAAALLFARACVERQPSRLECKNAVRDYTVSGNSQILQKIFARGGAYDLNEVLARISEIQVLDPGVFSRAETAWAQAIEQRLESLKKDAGTGANASIDQAKELFAGNQLIAAIEPVQIKIAPSKFAAEVNAAMDKALLGTARDLLKEASETESEHPDIVRLKAAYNARVREAKELYDAYKEQYSNQKFDAALATMEDALEVWADSSTFKKEHARVVAKLNTMQSSVSDAGARYVAEALPPTAPCEDSLAGYGKRKKGTCFYFVSGNQRGPLMVVVPAGDTFNKPFAIGKYEITVSDFNRYCALSGSCAPFQSVEGRLPVSGISLAQAQAYTAWLSERTGQKFRLPTAEEWLYAAGAAGEQPKKDYNCRVEQGGQIIKGQSLTGVNAGKANGWGLYNYIGNVQELTLRGDSPVARGGAYRDSFSKCGLSLERSHDGEADEITGFRVLLELG